ncbi:hypothetical protein KY417_001179 [Campylobacter jejuni]|nr:hypothetical protein [Campylobacter jejuni]EFP2059069.1 hypothetical protein [Campylobacter jejuni]EHU3473182.1 hypothetical protein [Campylobacter jejuni]
MKVKDFDFRIWDKNGKCFISSIEVDNYLFIPTLAKHKNSNDCVFIEFSCDKNTNETKINKNSNIDKSLDLEIELWTGLYDKNGNKIYTGDIVSIDNDPFIFVDEVFIDAITGIELLHTGYHLRNVIKNFAYGDYLNEVEVIGNIHENENLLK